MSCVAEAADEGGGGAMAHTHSLTHSLTFSIRVLDREGDGGRDGGREGGLAALQVNQG